MFGGFLQELVILMFPTIFIELLGVEDDQDSWAVGNDEEHTMAVGDEEQDTMAVGDEEQDTMAVGDEEQDTMAVGDGEQDTMAADKDIDPEASGNMMTMPDIDYEYMEEK